jgi:hypothetical protein
MRFRVVSGLRVSGLQANRITEGGGSAGQLHGQSFYSLRDFESVRFKKFEVRGVQSSAVTLMHNMGRIKTAPLTAFTAMHFPRFTEIIFGTFVPC